MYLLQRHFVTTRKESILQHTPLTKLFLLQEGVLSQAPRVLAFYRENTTFVSSMHTITVPYKYIQKDDTFFVIYIH